MTEKRFTVEKNDKWIAILDNGETIGNAYHICGLLNKLYEENKKLKKERDSLIQGIQGAAKMGADGIVKSMEQNFTIDTKYYRRRY